MNHLSKRIAGLLLALAMILSLLPMSAMATAQEVTAELPLGEEAVFANLAETPEASHDAAEPAQLAADGDLTIPGYNKVIHRSQIQAERKYLIVAKAPDETFYALHINADGTSGHTPGDTAYPDCTATLTVSGGTVSAVRTSSTETSVDMNDLLVTITPNGTNYTIKNANYSLKLNGTMYDTAANAPALPLEFVTDSRFSVQGNGRYLTFNVNGATTTQTHLPDLPTGFCGWNDKQPNYIPIYLYIQGDLPEVIEPELEFPTPPSGATIRTNAEMIPASGTSEGQPFASGTGGSTNFRIPAIITLRHQRDAAKNGRIVAAIDARWNTTADAGCLDTILSYSDDNGATWSYNFPNYFGDSTNAYHSSATAFIDPQLTEALDGTLYLLVDIWPGGVALNSADNNSPDHATGYVTVDGVKRMALYTSVSGQTDSNYEYYVGDFDSNGYATIYKKDKTETDLYVDQYYYLYRQAGDARDADNDKVYCERLGGNNEWVQQNLFFKRAALHVRYTSHLWIVKSTDGGATWSKPILNNDQVRTGEHGFYGVGPGAGLCVETNSETNPNAIPNGTILMPTYFNPGEIASFIYTTDNGATWRRGNNASSSGGDSSESCLVQLNDTTVRHFYRDSWSDSGVFRYTDHTWDATANDGVGGWITGEVVRTDIPRRGPCQMAALRYSQPTEAGETIILLSAPTNPSARKNGKVYAAKVKADGTMEKLGSYEVTGEDENYAYSSISELADGRIAVFYEDTGTNVPVKIIPFGTIRYGEELGGLIRQADALKAAAYSEATWAALQTALTPARAAMENGVKADIEKAADDLRTALDNLEILNLVITGTVKNATTNALVSGAVVTLEDEDYRPVGLTATTGTDGVFRFASTDDVPLPVGTYQLKVQAPGYLVSTHAATEITDRNNLTSTTPITLTPESTEGSIYSNNFESDDISMMGYLSPDGTSGVPTFEHVEYNGSGAVKITFHSTSNETRHENNAVVKVNAAKFKNGTVSFDVTGLTNTIRLGVTLRGVDPTHRIYVGLEQSESKWFWEWWNGSTTSYGGAGVKDIGIHPGETRRVRVELDEKKVQVFIDGVKIYDVTMGDKDNVTPPLAAGYVGINMQSHSGTEYILDNFRVVSKDEVPENSHYISGKVTDRKGNGIPNAQVVIKTTGGQPITRFVTNANGEYKLAPTTETSVKLSVSVEGYVCPAEDTVALTTNVTKNISLAADTSALQTLYNNNCNKEQEEYSNASWAVFTNALAAADTVLQDNTATKGEVDQAIADLNAAIAGLTTEEEPAPVVKTALTDAIAAATQAAADQTIAVIDNQTADQVDKGKKFVTTAEKKALTDAITAAQTVADDADATQTEVDSAVITLNEAVATFNTAVKTGTKETSTNPPSPSTGGNTSRPATSTTTETKDDGTKVTTVTKPDGTKVETTESPDGAKEVVETKKDGTVTATTETPDGTKAVVETKPDGSKTQTVEQSDGTKSELVATKDGDVTITVTDESGEELVKTEIPAAIPEPETKFEDVDATPWAEEAIHKMAGLELVNGTGDNKYNPVAPMTRGSLATVLHRLSQGKTDYENTFKDVAKGQYYTEGVAWAAKANVVKGVSEDAFAPDQVITREQLAVMLARYAKLVGLNTKADAKTLESFTDSDATGAWAVDGMAWCVENGILKGKGQNDLDPTADVTRAEVAVMLDRFIALLK